MSLVSDAVPGWHGNAGSNSLDSSENRTSGLICAHVAFQVASRVNTSGGVGLVIKSSVLAQFNRKSMHITSIGCSPVVVGSNSSQGILYCGLPATFR
jgi:hypothetical protein